VAAHFWRCVLAIELALAVAIGFTSMQLGIGQERGATADTRALALLQFLLIACSSSWRPCSPMNTGSDGTAIYGRS